MNKGNKNRLTAKQEKIYICILDYRREYGYPPTVREIGKRVGLKSTSSVHNHLKALEDKGFIERKEDCPRAISLIPVGVIA